jgi:2-polyprenyl-3-methyl-5-hydroxy-6-metoxy-1,4-benzoquinol methylase
MRKKRSIKDTEAMDIIRHLRILIGIVRNKIIKHRSLLGTKKYWEEPDDNNNSPFNYVVDKKKNPKPYARTENLINIIDELGIKNPKILEIGCNAGRNINGLFKAGYKDITAIEISQNAINVMEKTFPETFSAVNIYCGSADEILSKFNNDQFDIVYTMAVLQHIHPEIIDHVTKEMVRVSDKYIITHEGETHSSWRHFPRSYRYIFSKLKLKYIKRQNAARIFSISHKEY